MSRPIKVSRSVGMVEKGQRAEACALTTQRPRATTRWARRALNCLHKEKESAAGGSRLNATLPEYFGPIFASCSVRFAHPVMESTITIFEPRHWIRCQYCVVNAKVHYRCVFFFLFFFLTRLNIRCMASFFPFSRVSLLIYRVSAFFMPSKVDACPHDFVASEKRQTACVGRNS